MGAKLNLKECFNDDTLDLSMNDLSEVPVKDIAVYRKATTLDLSSNNLVNLPRTFAPSLIHLVKLDLAQNRISNLPENIGLLVHLKHLDLYKNQLINVPLSFGSLRSLRWLDLKENPLVPKMAQIAGPCLDNQGCHAAAKNVVNYMAEIQRKVEEEQQRKQELNEKLYSESNVDNESNKGKQKKKKKKKNNQPSQDKITTSATDDFTDHLLPTTNHVNSVKKANGPKKSQPSFVWRMLCRLFKLATYGLILAVLLGFIISLVDEPTYHQARVKVQKVVVQVKTKLPSTISVYSDVVYDNAKKYTKLLFEHTVELSGVVLNKTQEAYTWFCSDETVQTYIATAKHYAYIGYVKASVLCTKISNKISSYLSD